MMIKKIAICNKIKSIGFVFSFLMCAPFAFSQHEVQYTQYMYNTMVFNPAYAGARDALSTFATHRTQWVGIDGAPVSNAVAAHAPLGNNVGIGGSFVNDKIGPQSESTFTANFSYSIETNSLIKVAFGISGVANLLNVDYTKLNNYDPNDPTFQNNVENKFSPNVGAGIYAYNDKAYVGLSVPNFFRTTHYDGSANSVYDKKMHLYLMGGYVFDLSPDFKFKPALLVKTVSGSPLSVDVSSNFMYRDVFTLGLAYRWDAAMSTMAGFQITDGLFVGYSYDVEMSDLSNLNNGSHEIFLRFELERSATRFISPRFF